MLPIQKDRFLAAIQEAGLDQSALAKRVGCTPGAINQIASGLTLRSRFLPDIADALGVSTKWLRGEEETGGPGTLPRREVPPDPVEQETVPVELLPTYAGAGGGGTGEGDVETIRFPRGLIERELRATSRDVLAVQVEGDSMEPMFVSGDQLLIDKRRTAITQPGAFCLWDGDGYVIKLLEKVYDSDPPKVRVLSKNAVYQAVERLVEEVRIMGRVVWFGRKV
jgi:phage repressor protein C with HTH and peptisase S24 domain